MNYLNIKDFETAKQAFIDGRECSELEEILEELRIEFSERGIEESERESFEEKRLFEIFDIK
jgi:hypothetical protein